MASVVNHGELLQKTPATSALAPPSHAAPEIVVSGKGAWASSDCAVGKCVELGEVVGAQWIPGGLNNDARA